MDWRGRDGFDQLTRRVKFLVQNVPTPLIPYHLSSPLLPTFDLRHSKQKVILDNFVKILSFELGIQLIERTRNDC